MRCYSPTGRRRRAWIGVYPYVCPLSSVHVLVRLINRNLKAIVLKTLIGMIVETKHINVVVVKIDVDSLKSTIFIKSMQ